MERMVLAQQAVDGCGFQRLGPVAIDIGERHEHLQRLIFRDLAAEAEQGFQNIVGILPRRCGTGELGVEFPLRMIGEQVLPDIDIAGQMDLAVRVDPQAGGQQQHICVRAEYRPRRTRTGHLAANRPVKTLQAVGIGQVVFSGSVDTGQSIEVTGEPTIVVRQKAFKKLRAFVRTRADQIAPGLLGTRTARNHGLAVADLEHTSEEVQYMRVDLQALRRNLLAQVFSSVWIEFRQAQVQTA